MWNFFHEYPVKPCYNGEDDESEGKWAELRRKWHWIDWVLFGIYTLMFGMSLLALFTKPERLGNPEPLLFTLQLAASFIVPLIFWRPGYIRDGWFAFILLFTAGIPTLYYSFLNHSAIGLILVPTIIVGYLSQKRTMYWTVPVYVAGIPIVLQLVLGKAGFADILYRMFDYFIMYGIGYSLKRIVLSNDQLKRLYQQNQKQYELIQEQNKALEQYARQVERITLLEERNRMAVELHDTVGHTFTSVIVGMDAVSYLMEASPAKAKEKLDVLRELTRRGLADVRRSIHQIAPEEANESLHQQLSHVAAEFAVHTDMKLDIQTLGNEPRLSQQVKWTLVRCLQEALTNAKRHGGASQATIRLMHDDKLTHLMIEDDGSGMDDLHFGFGLTAMSERLKALTGSLTVTSGSGRGTVVQCTVPHLNLDKESDSDAAGKINVS